MRKEICVCTEIRDARDKLGALKTTVKILRHHREEFLTTNTAHWAELLLPKCQIFVRGLQEEPLNWEKIIDPKAENLFLYPAEDAIPLSVDFVAQLKRPANLIVPDGSWRQASKVGKREKALANITKVTLVEGAPSRYHLRREPKVGGLATLEAIARSLGYLENSGVQREIEQVFLLMVDRTLRSRNSSSGLPSLGKELA